MTTTTTHIRNVPLAHGELSLVVAKSAEEATDHSWEIAAACQQLGVGVLLVNTGISKRRFTMADPRRDAPSSHERQGALLMVHTSNRGNVVGETSEIQQLIRDCNIGVVIISSWEWTSSNYGRQRSLRYFLREIMEEEDVAVIVYSQTATTPVAGRYDRGGTGRLAEMAVAVADIRGSRGSSVSSPRPAPIIFHGSKERAEIEMLNMERTVREANALVNSKINDLGPHLGSSRAPDDPPLPNPERRVKPFAPNGL
jgi:hypothetical protein